MRSQTLSLAAKFVQLHEISKGFGTFVLRLKRMHLQNLENFAQLAV